MKTLSDLSKELQKEYLKRKKRIMQRMYDAYKSPNAHEVASAVEAERACLRKLNKEFGLPEEDTTRRLLSDVKAGLGAPRTERPKSQASRRIKNR